MRTLTTRWQTPKMLLEDWEGPESKRIKQSIESDVVAPAIRAIESMSIGRYLAWMSMNGWNIEESQISDEPIPKGWDTDVRFKVHGKCPSGLLLEQVFKYKNERTDHGIWAGLNPEFESPGVVIFARSSPTNAHKMKVTRTTEKNGESMTIILCVTVTITNEHAFRCGWFRKI